MPENSCKFFSNRQCAYFPCPKKPICIISIFLCVFEINLLPKGYLPMTLIADMREPLNLPEVTSEAEDALLHAQELAFRAMEAGTPAKRLELAQKSLAISPYCLDAYNILAQESETDEEALEIYRCAESVGKRYFGDKYFNDNKGIFWEIIGTRPYMRVKQGIAFIYKERGDRKSAIKEFQEMLTLCEDDNLGVRDLLLPLLIGEKELKKAEKLAKRYEAYNDANWLYAFLLLEFAKNEPEGEVESILKKALKKNREAANYLALKKKMPDEQPEFYSLGSNEEAVYIAYCQLDAWKSTLNACEWLAGQIVSRANKKAAV